MHKKMNRNVTFFTALLCLLILTGCQNSQSQRVSNPTSPALSGKQIKIGAFTPPTKPPAPPATPIANQPQPSASNSLEIPEPSACIPVADKKIALLFLIDTSTSMAPKIYYVTQAMLDYWAYIRDTDLVGINVFNGSPYAKSEIVYGPNGPIDYVNNAPVIPGTFQADLSQLRNTESILPIAQFDDGNEYVRNLELKVTVRGSTHTKDGFILAKQTLQNAMAKYGKSGYTWNLVFLSDGEPKNRIEGPPDAEQDPTVGADNVVDQIKGMDVRLISIGVGLNQLQADSYSYATNMLQKIASSPNDLHFVDTISQNDISAIFKRIQGGICRGKPVKAKRPSFIIIPPQQPVPNCCNTPVSTPGVAGPGYYAEPRYIPPPPPPPR